MIDSQDNRPTGRRPAAIGVAAALVTIAAAMPGGAAHGRGVSPYLPLNQSPEIERQIERLLILAEVPVMTRPLAAATVLDALPKACERDAALCEQVRRYLSGYMRNSGLGHMSVAAGGGSGPPTAVPNRHGLSSDSAYELSASLYWQSGDYWLVAGGVHGHEDEATPTGTVLSVGHEYAQVDIGYRDHWLSPLTDSAMLLGTQAPTMPSITVSNYTPISRWRLRYEVFLGEMSESSDIVFGGGFTAGNPRLAGAHFSIEPLPGWSLGINRIMQFGGGEREDSLGDLFDAFFSPSSDNVPSGGNVDEEFGNQAASFTSRFLMSTPIPFAVYFEYAGEDTSTTSDVRLGNAALSAGVHFPLLGRNLDLTFEASEWQNGWYVHHIYRDGLRHEGRVIGHWGGDWRAVGDGVGARSWMARLGWQPRFGGSFEATVRGLENEAYTPPEYDRAHHVELRYSRPWQEFFVGAELIAGRDVFGESYSRLSAFLRF